LGVLVCRVSAGKDGPPETVVVIVLDIDDCLCVFDGCREVNIGAPAEWLISGDVNVKLHHPINSSSRALLCVFLCIFSVASVKAYTLPEIASIFAAILLFHQLFTSLPSLVEL
jgi:hypothetical protein